MSRYFSESTAVLTAHGDRVVLFHKGGQGIAEIAERPGIHPYTTRFHRENQPDPAARAIEAGHA